MELSELKSEIEALKQNTFNPTKFRYPNDIRQKIKLINDQGLNIQKISEYLGPPHQTIRNWLSEIRNKFAHSLNFIDLEIEVKKIKMISNIEKDEDFTKLNFFQKYSLMALINVHYLNNLKMKTQYIEQREIYFKNTEKQILEGFRVIYKEKST